MEQKISFKDYYELKRKLLNEENSSVEFKTTHSMCKYCKLPVISESEKKQYLSLKASDKIDVIWTLEGEEIYPKNIKIDDNLYKFSWKEKKAKSWILSSSIQI